MTETRVVHCKKEPYDVYIGRPSIFGNPYSHKNGTAAEYKVETREQAVTMYGQYAYQRSEKDVEFRDAVLALDGKVLGCWCTPQVCHGDVLVRLVKRLRQAQQPILGSG